MYIYIHIEWYMIQKQTSENHMCRKYSRTDDSCVLWVTLRRLQVEALLQAGALEGLRNRRPPNMAIFIEKRWENDDIIIPNVDSNISQISNHFQSWWRLDFRVLTLGQPHFYRGMDFPSQEVCPGLPCPRILIISSMDWENVQEPHKNIKNHGTKWDKCDSHPYKSMEINDLTPPWGSAHPTLRPWPRAPTRPAQGMHEGWSKAENVGKCWTMLEISWKDAEIILNPWWQQDTKGYKRIFIRHLAPSKVLQRWCHSISWIWFMGCEKVQNVHWNLKLCHSFAPTSAFRFNEPFPFWASTQRQTTVSEISPRHSSHFGPCPKSLTYVFRLISATTHRRR